MPAESSPALVDDLNVAISRTIHSRRRALSTAVVERQYMLRPEFRERYGERGREKCIEDTEFHLAHLSAALLAASPALFAGYIEWVASVMVTTGVRLEDVRENLVCIQELIAEKLPAGMASVASSYVGTALERFAESRPVAPSHLPREGAYAGLAAEYLRLLLACQRHAAGHLILDAVDGGMPIREVYLQIFQPCQRELGRLWQAGEVSVAQEHYCTAATQLIMSQLAPRLFTTARNGRRAVIACVAGEAHEVGTRMIADLLELAGWDTIFLGGNVPVKSVVQTLVEHRADLLASSATMMYHLPAMIDLIDAVRAEPGCAALKIMVGGRLFDVEPGLWERVGADGHAANADEACRLADQLGNPQANEAKVAPRLPGPSHAASAFAPARMPQTLYDALGRVNSEVVALNREMARKNAEVERLHAEVTRQSRHLADDDRRKNEFLAMLGHELRNPLAPLRNALALLGPDDPDAETVRWARDIMGRQVGQIVRLVEDLLDLSRIMQGKLELRTERIDLRAVVTAAVETARPVIDSKGHELAVSLPAEPLDLDADPIRLGQALVNLLNNAAKYSDPGGQITLAARREGAEVVLSVRDSGVGIAAEMLPRIFDLFMQEGRSVDRSRGGLGVGLALVKSLVEMHGGSVQARSDGPGRGSEFVIRLPAPTPAAAPEQAGGPKPIEATRLRRRILVVDDNEDAANSLAKLLSRAYRHEVRVAHDGPAALALAGEFRPEVVLLDIGLPGMDGNEVARLLREQPEFAETLIVALTGWGQESDVERSQAAGFDHHLLKPVDLEALLGLLTRSR